MSDRESVRAIRILAKSVCSELQSAGYSRTHLVRLATEILGNVSRDEAPSAEREDRAAR